MKFSEKWIECQEARKEYSLIKGDLLNQKTILLNDLKYSFETIDDTFSALDFIQSLIHEDDLEMVKDLFPELIDIALDGRISYIPYARKCISLVNRKWLNDNIESFIKAYLASKADEEWIDWICRRIAELYYYLGLDNHLKRHLEFCKVHPSDDVKEIADDFKSYL